ncbi:MAG: N-acetylmuramoyl-L-alanine amidase [Candidatus Omnitrophica bacterium]|nr:N-acetylmuramoyl-L-alanine amidase [Candidatus Omnitrophota bacterium]MBU1810279.1 N-acetylmuramoyl-L-alanine amidase [Candidatus Omnitrophota bacterium]
MNKLDKFAVRVIIIGLTIILSSCVRAPIMPVIYPPKEIPILRQDAVHTVAPGETVWRIAKMYNIETKDIMRANSLRKPEELEMGQRLLIPDAAPLKAIISLYPSNKWKYIIIHHSATDVGNSLAFHESHRLRGWKTVGYHFIIDNGTKDKQDGQIEVSPRWLKQQDGAHCNASGMNKKGIGICLVGNFNEQRVSEKQMESLIYLINRLKKYYRIPIRNIVGHGQVSGAKTECPGKYFPWRTFETRLRASD